MTTEMLAEILSALDAGAVIPYLGPDVLGLDTTHTIPKSPDELVARITAQSPVPAKLRKNLYGAAQFIENFKHRQTLRKAMSAAFSNSVQPNALFRFIARQTNLRMVVSAWYDSILPETLASRTDWLLIQGASRADCREAWFRCFGPNGALLDVSTADVPDSAKLLLYAPLGGYWPEQNYLVSDSDFVEVLTEIDIQTPIPRAVQSLRSGRNFLFLGCRFNSQMERQIACQIMKRSSRKHWAVIAEEPTRNEERFLREHHIGRIAVPLAEFVARLSNGQPLP